MSRVVLVVGCLVVALIGGSVLGSVMAFRDMGASVRLIDNDPTKIGVDVPPSAVSGGNGEGNGLDPTAPAPANSALISAMRSGGFVVFVQHPQTQPGEDDAEALDLTNCTTQRNLSEAGRAQARAIGEAFRTRGIPIGEVFASPLCRTRETAELAFGKASLNPMLNVIDLLRVDDTTEQRGQALRRLLGQLPAPGQNNVIVGHWQNLMTAVGVQPDGDGEAAVFRPAGTGATLLVARVPASGWAPRQ